jgi:hypothetical protein
LLLGGHPLSLLSEEFGFPQLHAVQSLLQLTDHIGEMLLLLFKLLSVELLALPGVKPKWFWSALHSHIFDFIGKHTQPVDSSASASAA